MRRASDPLFQSQQSSSSKNWPKSYPLLFHHRCWVGFFYRMTSFRYFYANERSRMLSQILAFLAHYTQAFCQSIGFLRKRTQAIRNIAFLAVLFILFFFCRLAQMVMMERQFLSDRDLWCLTAPPICSAECSWWRPVWQFSRKREKVSTG